MLLCAGQCIKYLSLSHSSCVGHESRADRERLSAHEGEERAQTEQGKTLTTELVLSVLSVSQEFAAHYRVLFSLHILHHASLKLSSLNNSLLHL